MVLDDFQPWRRYWEFVGLPSITMIRMGFERADFWQDPFGPEHSLKGRCRH